MPYIQPNKTMQNTIQATQNTTYLTKLHKENTKYKIPKMQNTK